MPSTIQSPLPVHEPEPWRDEYYHATSSYPLIRGEKGADGQRRLARHYAAALASSPLASARLVASKLRGCSPHDRCGSGVCPPCTWAAGRGFRGTVAKFTSTADLTIFSTIQLPDDRALPVTLDEVTMGEQRTMLATALVDAGLGEVPLMGAADFSINFWNLHNEKRWSVHWALFTVDRNPKAFTAALTAVLPRHTLVPVPVKTKPITRTPHVAFSYGFKNAFERKAIPRAAGATGRGPIIRPGDVEFDTLAVNIDRIGIMSRCFTQACAIATDNTVQSG
jgi:hypothetical protein